MARARYLDGRSKFIRVSEQTVNELKKLKVDNENYDMVIRRLIKYYRMRELKGF